MSGKHSRRLSRAESARNSGTLGIAYHIVNMGSDQDDQRTDAINTVKKMALGATAVLISSQNIYEQEGRSQELSREGWGTAGNNSGPATMEYHIDEVLHTNLSLDDRLVYYADDTLIKRTGDNPLETKTKAERNINTIIKKIENMGLQVALQKKEAAIFYKKRKPDNGIKHLQVEGHNIQGLLPNKKGASEKKRRLYAMNVTNAVTYGSKIWKVANQRNHKLQNQTQHLQRPIAVRGLSGDTE
ncbi:hypothetical protein RUM44_002753 [Polyplax serrata]|uniref:Reverse transcriptase domain-containing protein n=1 Tax=Polyplax serrata TaxID=468196 RepID=A0ABR1AG59_POLSC